MTLRIRSDVPLGAAALDAIAALDAFAMRTPASCATKPWVSLVLPADFALDRAVERLQLETVLPMLAALAPRYRVRVVIPDATVTPVWFSPVVTVGWEDAVRSSLFNIVLGSRALARRVRGVNSDTSFVASDPCSFNRDKWRIYWPQAKAASFALPWQGTLAGKSLALFVSPWDDLELLADFVARAAPAFTKLLLNARDWSSDVMLPPALAAAERIVISDTEERVDAASDVIASQTAAVALFISAPAFIWLDGDDQPGELVPKTIATPGPQIDLLYKGVDLNHLKVVERALADPASTARPTKVTSPLVSIVVPVYDRTVEIERLADSILQQDYGNLEVIFVSNGSPRATVETLTRIKGRLTSRRIKVELLIFAQAFGSATIPRDVGVYHANGDLICFIDSDDWFAPDFFEVMRGACDLRTIYYPHKMFHNFGRQMPPSFPYHKRLSGIGAVATGQLFKELKFNGNFFANSGIIAPRRLCEDVCGIWHRLKYAEDYYLWLALAHAGASAYEHDGTVNIALHPNNNELKVGDDAWVKTALARAESGVLAW